MSMWSSGPVLQALSFGIFWLKIKKVQEKNKLAPLEYRWHVLPGVEDDIKTDD